MNYQAAVQQLTTTFEGIGLKDMGRVSLLNRQDSKAIIHIRQLPKLLQQLTTHYFIVDINGYRSTTYDTLYYDTEKLDLYLQHHNQRLSRYKIRFRKYVESSLTFLEVKEKSNKGRTIKNRIKVKDIATSLDEAATQLIQTYSPLEVGNLLPTLWVLYNRMTFVAKDFSERVTIDTNLHFKRMDGEKVEDYTPLTILEIKQNRFNPSSPMMTLLGQEQIRLFKISKYCTGILSCFEEVKHNRFKSKLLRLKKIIQTT